MYKQCKTVRSSARQQEFQKALFALLQTQAYDTITVTKLCQITGIPRNTFYRYFDSIDDVLYAEMDGLILSASLFLWDRANISGYLQFWREHKDFLDILAVNGLSPAFMIRAHILLSEKYKDVKFSVQNIRGLCYLNGLMTILITWHHDGMKQTIEEIEAAFWQVYQRE